MNILDTNVYLSRWPFRRLWGDEPANLLSKLRQRGVSQAWAGSFDALLYRDIAGVNIRLANACREHGEGILIPFGTVNPKFPDWQEDLRRCQEVHKMPGIRLHPNYHGYKLDDPSFAELLKLATERRLIVQIAQVMEDSRTQTPLMQIPAVDLAPLPDLVKATPGLRVQLLNCGFHAERRGLPGIFAGGNVYMDIATVEGVGGIGRLVQHVPLPRVLFGSYYPYFNLESSLLKVQESGLDESGEKAICQENARRLMDGS